MTTRKLAAAGALPALLALAGCATPGPLHLYAIDPAAARTIRDVAPADTSDVPSFLAPGETLTGFAYDPFTDHFFLRLAPGNRFRVVDRPARAIKREFQLAGLPAGGGGDLAIRPRDGHVFALLAGAAGLAEFTRYGELLRTLPLDQTAAPPLGLAYDSARDRLLLLTEAAPARVTIFATDGRPLSRLSLERAVAPGCLAFDPGRRELYAPLADHESIGVFGEDGRLRRTLPLRLRFFDVGPRSFLRLF